MNQPVTRTCDKTTSPEDGSARPAPGMPAQMPAQRKQHISALARSLALLTAVLLPLPLLAGCGGGDPEPEKPTSAVFCTSHPETCK